MKMSIYKTIELLNKLDTVSFLFLAFLSLLFLVLLQNARLSKKIDETIENCQFKIVKLSDINGKYYFKIFISENNGINLLDFQDYINSESLNFGPLLSYSLKEYDSVCSKFESLEEAVNELYNFRKKLRQPSIEKSN
ncbi:hypothetical protein [uncultured Flavobacterium sp.]|uniref:hypothetical protein n=1 Tax=uncultured Flavobacterium sp. TaxID=165435 RepID=UPI002599F98D|nr:hypothetical protein [uncultured Flavobacterium sp.]